MVAQEKLYTAEDFWEIAQLTENADKTAGACRWGNYRNATFKPDQHRNCDAHRPFLYAFVIPNNLGYVTGADGGYTLTTHNARQPDVAFISRERHPKLEGVAFPIAPDLAVEVISPSEGSNDVSEKGAALYRRWNSARVGGLPPRTTVYVWTLLPMVGLHVKIFSIEDSLNGGDVLPGFTLKVRDIFPN